VAFDVLTAYQHVLSHGTMYYGLSFII